MTFPKPFQTASEEMAQGRDSIPVRGTKEAAARQIGPTVAKARQIRERPSESEASTKLKAKTGFSFG
ncbi:hypothetical protein ACG2K1_06615 [Neisseria sp. 23W00296]|uniref:hypothetical protein n=1 Tax=unclassified Neisseria TaxID=2623750 RepID=UPI003756D449